MTFDIGKFQILKKYESNCFSSVYKVRNKKTGEIFVIKKIKVVKLEYQLREIQMH